MVLRYIYAQELTNKNYYFWLELKIFEFKKTRYLYIYYGIIIMYIYAFD